LNLRLQLGVKSEAVISGDKDQYRYILRRTWDENLPKTCWICLNPSTADANTDDPTLHKIQTFCRLWGYGQATVVNLFAFRSKFPIFLHATPAPVGPMNDMWINQEATGADLVICAWGKEGWFMGRGAEVLSRIRTLGVTPMALKLNKDGSPQHPLYISLTAKPMEIPE
jgi:hypothetical protein